MNKLKNTRNESVSCCCCCKCRRGWHQRNSSWMMIKHRVSVYSLPRTEPLSRTLIQPPFTLETLIFCFPSRRKNLGLTLSNNQSVASVCAISRCAFLCWQYIHLYYVYYVCSDQSLVMFSYWQLWFSYWNGWRPLKIPAWFGGRVAGNLFILSIVCVYTFFCIFLYGALCPRFDAIEISIISST